MNSPLAIDLFCGLGGWTDGLLAEGWDVIGFDIERHRYPARQLPPSEGVKASGVKLNASRKRGAGFNCTTEAIVRNAPLTGGWIEYPAQLVVQDVLTLHGSQFRNADLIVASPPCQAYSYRAMPWKRAKALPPPCNALFDACFRIQREACEAAGRHIPLIVENVRGAQPWVGRARWNYGSFYLWGDVPALMPITFKGVKVPTGGQLNWSDYGKPGYKARAFNTTAEQQMRGRRTDPGKGARFTSRDCGLEAEGIKQRGSGREWFAGDGKISRMTSSKSPSRKMASAMIAKIPLPLSRYIAATFRPVDRLEAAE